MDIDLRGGQSDAWGGVHGLQHIGDQLLERGIELLHRESLGAQPGIWEFQYGQQGHRYSLLVFLNVGKYAKISRIRGQMTRDVTQCTKLAINHVRLPALKFITAAREGPTRSQEVAGMYLNQAFGVKQAIRVCATFTALLAFGGCSMF